MVWGFFPVDLLPGEDKYFIFRKGTYKVGRKGCDIIVNKDKGVSRVHAEVLVDVMFILDHTETNSSSGVRIRDCSKYGTFVNKNLGSKGKVHEFPNKEAAIRDGDLVSFGTGNATYRLSFVPFKFLVYGSEPFEENQLQGMISSIGASTIRCWSSDCTHVLVNQFMELTEDLADPLLSKMPFVLAEWVEVLAGKGVCNEIPSCSFYAPSFMLEGVPVKVAEAKSRENCLRGHTFLLEAVYKYRFKDKLVPLLELVGAKVIFVEEFCSHSQGSEVDDDNMVVLIIPFGMENNFVSSRKLSSLPRLKEKDVICAVFSGHLDASSLVAAPVVVSSSCSTDETVVADSDVEIETAASLEKSIAADTTAVFKHESKEECYPDYRVSDIIPKRDMLACSTGDGDTVTTKREQVDEPECGSLDIIYSQNLIVRDTNLPASINSSFDNGVPNFKRFRKSRTPSGNSFYNLVPYAKTPYKESDYGSEVAESVKEEKKRKQMEAMAEEIFNNDKGRRRTGSSGFFSGIFARR